MPPNRLADGDHVGGVEGLSTIYNWPNVTVAMVADERVSPQRQGNDRRGDASHGYDRVFAKCMQDAPIWEYAAAEEEAKA